jgi:hypothetical protein
MGFPDADTLCLSLLRMLMKSEAEMTPVMDAASESHRGAEAMPCISDEQKQTLMISIAKRTATCSVSCQQAEAYPLPSPSGCTAELVQWGSCGYML